MLFNSKYNDIITGLHNKNNRPVVGNSLRHVDIDIKRDFLNGMGTPSKILNGMRCQEAYYFQAMQLSFKQADILLIIINVHLLGMSVN